MFKLFTRFLNLKLNAKAILTLLFLSSCLSGFTQQVLTFNSIADASVYVGSTNTNYGSSTFQVKNSTTGGITRYAYIKFDLGALTSSQVGTATLRLYCSAKATPATVTKIDAFSTSTNWDESTLTYTNRPDFIAPLNTTNVASAGTYYEWDVTNYVKQLVSNNTIVSIGLSDELKSNNQIVFYTKENGSINLPQLVVSDAVNPNPINTVPLSLNGLFSDGMVMQQQKVAAPVYGKAGIGSTITVTPSWNNTAYTATTDVNGRWSVNISTPIAGAGPYTINVHDGDGHTANINDVQIGEVWFCSGQSNMEMKLRGNSAPILNSAAIIAAANDPNIRVFTLPYSYSITPQYNCSGSWQAANPTNAPEFSAVAYQYAKALKAKLNVPIGIIVSAVGGTTIQAWMSAQSLQAFPEVTVPNTLTDTYKTTTSLFNGMVNPIAGYGIRGFLWYQGESNRNEPYLYKKLFPALVSNWRTNWGDQTLPFYFVQIAPNKISDPAVIGGGVKMREVQFNSVNEIANSGIGLCMDIGEENEIHYGDKTTIANRLSYLALNKTYGYSAIPYLGPKYNATTFSGNQATLSFDNATGLKFSGNTASLFEIAGSDKIFKPATATITNDNKIIVSSVNVTSPVAVRYAFSDWVIGNLYNGDNLPATSFRTINWDPEAPLPINLISFTGKTVESGISLSWITASETNNEKFELSHSIDGKSFTKITELKGAGNSSAKLNYNFLDNHPIIGTNYYKLQQVDFDGKSTQSNIIALNFKSLGNEIIIYPNPTSGHLYIKSIGQDNQIIKVDLYDLTGKLFKSKIAQLSENSIDLDVVDLVKGTYLLKITNRVNNTINTHKIILN